MSVENVSVTPWTNAWRLHQTMTLLVKAQLRKRTLVAKNRSHRPTLHMNKLFSLTRFCFPERESKICYASAWGELWWSLQALESGAKFNQPTQLVTRPNHNPPPKSFPPVWEANRNSARAVCNGALFLPWGTGIPVLCANPGKPAFSVGLWAMFSRYPGLNW